MVYVRDSAVEKPKPISPKKERQTESLLDLNPTFLEELQEIVCRLVLRVRVFARSVGVFHAQCRGHGG